MKAKKALGQNFLKSEPALRKIIEVGEIGSKDVVLEIGPGKGALTKQLLASGCQLIAVEKDNNLCELLKTKFRKKIMSGQLNLIHEDILKFNIDEAILVFMNGLAEPLGLGARKTEDLSKNLKLRKYKIIANIPYNITGAILKKFLTGKKQPKSMVLMVQHEVAKRIIARDGKESVLSISVKAYGKPKLIMKVPARYFSPAPKVDSAIIAINNISREIFIKNKISEEKFWEIVKAGFAHKRKKLGGNLKNLKNQVNKEVFENLKEKRAENLNLFDWVSLVKG